jgi:four helix bundle protein
LNHRLWDSPSEAVIRNERRETRKDMRNNFENLTVYHRSLEVAVKIMKVIDDVRPFRLAEQIISSSISIPSNIAEGSERGSSKDFIRFLEYSSGSASELITQLTIISKAEKKINLDLPELILELNEINAMLRGLIKSLQHKV